MINETKETSPNVPTESVTTVTEYGKTESAATTEVKEDSTEKKDKDAPLFKRLNQALTYDLMKVPTYSEHEYRMVMFIIIWARRNNIDYEMDDFGNLYLSKGTLNENEYYPCVTAHLDTVQEKQKVFAAAGANLDVKTTIENGKHKIYVDGFGIGGDDKAGLVLCLNMFEYFDKLKACFFLCEERGDVGSSHLNKDWFKDVGYVIGYDSPDLNRAAYKCSGVDLMDKNFFVGNGIDVICKNHGLNVFQSEPITDVVQIRKQTNIVCMNFGTGYYQCHTSKEYCILEDMDEALDLGVDIITKLGLTRHILLGGDVASYVHDANAEYFESLNPKPPVTYTKPAYNYKNNYYGDDYYGDDGYGNDYYYNQPYGKKTTANTPTATVGKEVNFEMVEYVSDVYEDRIAAIELAVEKKCKELGISFEENFADIFETNITF